MNRERQRDLPILTDVVELHATASAPKAKPAAEPASAHAGEQLSSEDIAALQAALVSRTMNLTDELLHAAARDIEAVMFERVIDRLRAALPELVAAALREHLASGGD
ncbi:MAG: hypothetical protein ACT4UP_11145 [Gammaproteobacteria bacterium]